MAQQHFYSRVPARVSMYNKYDSYDTFAHSAGLSREFVERDLSIVYADKLGKNDVSFVRKGEVSPVYYQCLVRSGNLVQGCITFLPLDYTMERSSYLTHTLVFSEEEKKALLYNSNNSIFNEEMYKHDITEFNITSPVAMPNSDYPTVDYVYKPISDVQGNLKKYDSEFVKDFIGALLLALCKKGKNVYFKLDVSDIDLSLEAMKIISEVMSILPYSLRSAVSFISYLNDPTKYPNFKLKAIVSKVPEVSLEKGVFFDFKTGLVTGLRREDIVANKPIINFFYSLLDNNEIRIEFLNYLDHIVEIIPGTQNLNIKTLSDLVFLFCQTSGFYKEELVLPGDEQIYEALCIYDKYRNALSDEYRIRAYQCLKRYVAHHKPIPKDIFSKVMRLYPAEIKLAKRIVMNVVLELIHTDIMREKLFVFISNNYEEEDDDIKEVINKDLCQVFYGGFMQANILKFFNMYFNNEPLTTQNLIIEKLLLSIRTINIQNNILEFFDEHYDYLSKEQLNAFYNTFFEMLVECDILAEALVKLVNKHIIKEPMETQNNINERLCLALEADYRRKEHLLLPMLMEQVGFCINAVMGKILGEWSNRKVFEEYLDILKEKPLKEKTNILVNGLLCVDEITENVVKKLIVALPELYENSLNKTLLYEWLEVDAKIKEILKTKKNQVLQVLLNDIILKGILSSLQDVFKIKYRTDGLDIILEYAKNNPNICSYEEYKLINNYVQLIECIENNKISKAFTIYNDLPENPKRRSNMADHLNTCIIDRKKQQKDQTIYFDLLVQDLKTGMVTLDKLYSQYKDVYKREYSLVNSNAHPKKVISVASESSLKLIFEICYEVTKGNEHFKNIICQIDSKLKTCILDFMNNYDGSSKKWLHNITINIDSTPFVDYFKKIAGETKSPNSSFLGKLFGKK